MIPEERRATLHPDDVPPELAVQPQRGQQPQGQRPEQPERSGQQPSSRAGTDRPLRGDELEQQILQSVQPVLKDLQREIVESVRRQVQQALTQPRRETGSGPATPGQQEGQPREGRPESQLQGSGAREQDRPPESTQQADQRERESRSTPQHGQSRDEPTAQQERQPRGEQKSAVPRLSPSGTSGIIIGGVAGAAVGGPIGAAVGIVVGGIAGEAIEHYLPSKAKSDVPHA